MAESNIEVTRTVTYQGNVELSLQQKTTKVAHLAQQFSMTGKKVEIEDQFGPAQAQTKDTRHGPTKFSDVANYRRWLAKPNERYFAKLVDNDDELNTRIDIKGPYTQTGAATVNRVSDEAWFKGYYDTNLTGEEGATNTSFTAGNVSATNYLSAGTGLTVEKIMWGREKLGTNLVDLDEEKAIVIITAKQVTDLLQQVEITSRDYNLLKDMAMQTGMVREILGCLFVNCEYGNTTSFPVITGGTSNGSSDLTMDGSGYRRVPMFVQSGMAVNTWQHLRASVDKRADLQGDWQIFAGRTVGACRVMEEKCLQLKCLEA